MSSKDLVLVAKSKFVDLVKETSSPLLWEKEMSFALQAISGNSALEKCNPNSITTAMVNVALTGLTLNPKKAYCYLIPRGGKAILDISYQGMIFLMTSQLNVKSLHAEVVYSKDYYKQVTTEKGIELVHEPDSFAKDRGEIRGCYAIAYLNGGGCTVATLSEDEITQIKATSQAAGSKYSPWSGSETIANEMRKKTAIRRLWKMIPKTERIEEAAEGVRVFDENHEAKFQKPVQDLDNAFEPEEINYEDVDEVVEETK